jgi:hypothetical protein
VSSNTAVANNDDAATFMGEALGTATISADIGVFHATASLTVAAECGSSSDPNAALVAEDQLPVDACAPSPDDLAAFGAPCRSTTDYPLCVKIMAGAKADGHAVCLISQQSDECVAWLDKLLRGDTSDVRLSTAQWQSILADTIGKTKVDSFVNFRNPDNGIVYPVARVWNWAGEGDGSYKYVLGRATIYYDSSGNPVALHDDYNFHSDSDDTPGAKKYLKDWIDDATDGKSFRVHWP